MKIHLHPWTSLKMSFPIRKSEWVLALMTTALWLILSIHKDLFATGGAYEGLSRWASQSTWAWLAFSIGVSRLAVLFVNGAYWRSPHFRAALSFLNCFIWYQLTVGVASNLGIELAAFTGILVLDIFNFRQAFIEAAASEGLRNGDHKRLQPHT